MIPRMRRARGFTLLEVMMATAVLAVGTISVLMVFGTALSFAHRRQGQQQLTQVLQEARSDARALVNSYRPSKSGASQSGSAAKDRAANTTGVASPAGQDPETQPKNSTVFAAYTYKLRFEPVRRDVPESGWRTTVTVNWGDGQEYAEAIVITSDVIPDEEFASSKTYEEERAGIDAAKSREKR
ncbi:MAG: prepilin-type N-terminal cleavage/methylation domain-containing protein [Planctomycetes bacterium]|nr:prepilin-type N-terminal cleavage/methylation domain-containing protein [Planctomycetota bacterium]